MRWRWPTGRFVRPTVAATVGAALAGLAAVAAGPAMAQSVAERLAAERPRAPELIFESPPELAPQVAALEAINREALVAMVELYGLEDPGPPIRIVVAAEGSPPTRLAPDWSVAYAFGSRGLVVLMPSRIPGYPDHSLEEVLRHEIAHVLLSRATGHRPVPRWFDEGLAMYAARPWGFDDRARLLGASIWTRRTTLADIEEGFRGGRHGAGRSYAFAGAFVRYLVSTEGASAPARILERRRAGESFESAVRSALGRPLPMLERAFWHRIDIWQRWVPFLTSSAFLWLLVTLLFLLAAKRRQERNAERRARWEAEERAELERLATDGWVH
ncbi:MAG: hypothetical protein AAGN46_06680 [Acidobacteriota bacterium]